MSGDKQSSRRRLVLHIGTHRTGTTAIQLVCHHNRARLREQGWMYPESGTGEGQRVYGHHRLAWAHTRDEGLQQHWVQALSEMRAQADCNVFISSEEFCKIESETSLALLRSQLSGFDVRVVVYLRRQDQYAQALYSVGVINGTEHRPIQTFVRNQKRMLDYQALLQRWEQAFGREALIVRIYERERFPNGNIAEDLMQILGCTLDTEYRYPSLAINRTYPRTAIRSVVRLRNLGLPADTIRSAVQLVRSVYRDSRSTHDLLSPLEAYRLWSGFEADNRKIARRFFPGQDSLFTPPAEPTPEQEEHWTQAMAEDDQALTSLFTQASAAIARKPAPQAQIQARPQADAPTDASTDPDTATDDDVDRRRIVFVHIPKTAGMSLFYALQQWAGEGRALRYARGTVADQDQFMQVPAEQLESMSVVSGHFNHSVFRRRCDERWSYISILRDPVDRFVSMFTYIRGWKGHPFHEHAVGRSFAQFYDWLITSPHNSNTQIKMLAGTEDLDQARQVTSSYRLIGSVAHMQVFEHELGRLLGTHLELGSHNRSAGSASSVVVEAAVREKIEQLNAADRALYDWVSRQRAVVND